MISARFVVTTHIDKEAPKLCKNCIFFKKSLFNNNKFGLCTFSRTVDTIDGSVEYPYASIYRVDKCKEKYYKEAKKLF
jgi:hypothetical protein